MKKQINPSIKAQIIRSAFYLLLLVAVCAIPFALAQRNTTKRSIALQPAVAKLHVSASARDTAARTQLADVSRNDQSQLRKTSQPGQFQVPTKTSGPSIHRLPILP